MSSAAGRPPVVPPPVRQDRSTALWWILGIVGGGIVVMVALGLMLAGFVFRNSRLDKEGKNVDIQTPVGELKVDNNQNHASGLPIYPGATTKGNDDQANLQILAGASGVGLAVETYSTPDSLEKVTAWYAQRLGPTFRRENPEDKTKKRAISADNDSDVSFVDDHGNGARVVGLKKQDVTVEISLLRVGKREPQ